LSRIFLQGQMSVGYCFVDEGKEEAMDFALGRWFNSP
jgi:hypothetical protein